MTSSAVVETPLPAETDSLIDLAPIADGERSTWLALTADGRLLCLDADSGAVSVVVRHTVPAEPAASGATSERAAQPRLHASADGTVAAVVNDHGHHGQVLDLRSGAVTLTLHGGDHHPETVPFSLAFAEHAGRCVVVHRTAWNRLNATDARTGELITERDIEGRPDLDPDYFHGTLKLSPSGRWLADDGWVWHPVGIPRVYDLRRWLDNDPGEAAGDVPPIDLCHRDYYWNHPMCWLDDDLLAVSGLGDDEDEMTPGVRIFDVGTGKEQDPVPGPRGQLFAAGGRLYAAAPEGLEVWDPARGTRTGAVPGFVPTHHHPTAGELVAVRNGTMLRWQMD
ncbi:YncE family protein [Actinoplanes sp. NPDC049681]|uniref:YncE family protein n=1 Tax=Actinoplanes sp. NPDC049681 TaxID=3363905 RepID=UPI00378AA325